jgi:hypothetical protein
LGRHHEKYPEEKSRLLKYINVKIIYSVITYIRSSRLYLRIFSLQAYETENSEKSKFVISLSNFLISLTSRILQSSAVAETEEWSIISLRFKERIEAFRLEVKSVSNAVERERELN